jgi:hypothetical protein
MKRKWLCTGILAGAAALSACGGGYYSGYAGYGPPPPRYGVVGVAPGPGYIWADGFWDLRGNRWEWREGRWMRPPRRGARYVHPEWRREGNRWRFHQGHWR